MLLDNSDGNYQTVYEKLLATLGKEKMKELEMSLTEHYKVFENKKTKKT